MYEPVKRLLLRVLKVPHEPVPPEGSAESLRVFRAARGYWHYRLALWALGQAWLVIVTVLAVAFLGRAVEAAPPPVRVVLIVLELLAVAAAVAGAFVSYATLRLDYEMRWYMVTDRSLRIREGVVHVHEMTMTFANIQNIAIDQGPLQRLLGIADVRVQSAGGGGAATPQQQGGHGGLRDLHVGYFRGVGDAEAIRDLVLKRLKMLRDAGLGDHDDAAASRAHGAGAPGAGGDLDDALRELRAETALLRQAAEAG